MLERGHFGKPVFKHPRAIVAWMHFTPMDDCSRGHFNAAISGGETQHIAEMLHQREPSCPLVSIIIPVYNGGDWLGDAIDSALAQTYSNIEVVVIDDGSNDGGATRGIAESYGDQISYLHKKNGGVATALNAGVAAMRGDYFSWLSHDDLYLPRKIERQIDVAQQYREPVVVFSDMSTIDVDGRILEDISLTSQARTRDHSLWAVLEGRISGCSLLIPKVCFEACGTFDTSLPTTQDYDLWYRFARRFRFVPLAGYLTQSRIHVSQGSRDLRHAEEAAVAWMRFLNPLPPELLLQAGEFAVAHRMAGSPILKSYFGARVYVKRWQALLRSEVQFLLIVDAREFKQGLIAHAQLESMGYGSPEIAFIRNTNIVDPDALAESVPIMRRRGRVLHADETLEVSAIIAATSASDRDRIIIVFDQERFTNLAALRAQLDRILADEVDAIIWSGASANALRGHLMRAWVLREAARRARGPRDDALRQELIMVGRTDLEPVAPEAASPHPPAASPPPPAASPHPPAASPHPDANECGPLADLSAAASVSMVLGVRTASLGRFGMTRMIRKPLLNVRAMNTILATGAKLGAVARGRLQTPVAKVVEWLFRARGRVDHDWYLKAYPDVRDRRENPALHYLRIGWQEGRDPSPTFSTRRYLEGLNDQTFLNPLTHSAFFGSNWDPDPNLGRFFVTRSLRRIALSQTMSDRILDVALELRRIVGHRLGAGPVRFVEWLFGVSGRIDRAWYLQTYPDIAVTGADPSLHFMRHGWRQERDPAPGFSTRINASRLSAFPHLNPLSRSVFLGRSFVESGASVPARSTPQPIPESSSASVPASPRVQPVSPGIELLLLKDRSSLARDWADFLKRDIARKVSPLLGRIVSSGRLFLTSSDGRDEWSFPLPDQVHAAAQNLRECGVRRIDVIGTDWDCDVDLFLDALGLPFDLTILSRRGEHPIGLQKTLMSRAERVLVPPGTLIPHLKDEKAVHPAMLPGMCAGRHFRVLNRPFRPHGEVRVLVLARDLSQEGAVQLSDLAKIIDESRRPVFLAISCDGENKLITSVADVVGVLDAKSLFELVGAIDPHIVWVMSSPEVSAEPILESAMRTGLPLVVTGSPDVAKCTAGRQQSWFFESPLAADFARWLEDAASGKAVPQITSVDPDILPAERFYANAYSIGERPMSKERRTLLVAGVPPCSNYSGGLFLETIIRATEIPSGIFVAQNPTLVPRVSADLEPLLRIRKIERPNEWYSAEESEEARRAQEKCSIDTFIRSATEDLLSFATEIHATDIWFVLEGQTLIRLAHNLLARTDLHLHVQVMDPPGWWLRSHNVDPLSSVEVLRQFDDIMKAAVSCAAASWAMADYYRRQYSTKAIAVVPGLDSALACSPACAPSHGTLRVGFAGQAYADQEFRCLVEAMKQIRNEGRIQTVQLHAYSSSIAPADDDVSSVIHLHPWTDQETLIKELSKLDLLYCPYWFSTEMREEATLSFPSKLTTYLAAGRPVVFHGRTDSSPGRFLIGGAAGFFCFREGIEPIKRTLQRSLVQQRLYAETAMNGRALFDRFLSLHALRDAFEAFMAEP